ncbi:hypothetical protein QM9_3516, partial [Clostridioides difficile DA00238]
MNNLQVIERNNERVWKPFYQGMIFYIESGSTHETINTGDREIKELIVSNN